MKVFFNTLAAGAFTLFAAGLFWLAVEMDNDELQAGKSPHSGFCPDSPVCRTGVEEDFDGCYQSSRTGSGSARSNKPIEQNNMKKEDCKPGTEAIIRVKILDEEGDSGLTLRVKPLDDKTTSCSTVFYCNPEALSPLVTKHDPARKFVKGDKVRVVEFQGRVFGNGLCKRDMLGKVFGLRKDPDNGGDVVIDGTNVSIACLELVKSVEEIESEPYFVKLGCVLSRSTDTSVAVFNHNELGTFEANRMAQELCDELNSKHLESLKA